MPPDVTERLDTVLVEEPLQLRCHLAAGVTGTAPAPVTTMRTPGHDLDLAFGLLLTEGVLGSPADVATAMHCRDTDEYGAPTYNVLDLTLAVPPRRAPARTLAATSACGVCGTATIDDVRARLAASFPVAGQSAALRAQAPLAMVDALRAGQRLFDTTGGAHAAALFALDLAADASGPALVVVREDVGRHNAVDKVIGHAARTAGWPVAQPSALVLSSRASFEIVAKAWVAQVPIVVAVSAASSLAVQVADEAGITLIGMVRDGRYNVYSHPSRIIVNETNTGSARVGQPSAGPFGAESASSRATI